MGNQQRVVLRQALDMKYDSLPRWIPNLVSTFALWCFCFTADLHHCVKRRKSAAILRWTSCFCLCELSQIAHSSHSLPLPGILLAGSSFIMLSTSPTCFLSLISRLFNLDRMFAMLVLLRLPYANPWDEMDLMAVGCH